jgi:hypothetical protein
MFSPLVIVLWVLALAAKCAVVHRAFQSKIFEYPLFIGFVFVSALRTVLLMAVAGDADTYRQVYFVSEKAVLLLETFAGLEAFWAFSVAYPWAGRIGLASTIAASAIGVGAYYVMVAAPISDRIAEASLDMNRFIGLILGANVAVVSVIFSLPGWDSRRTAIHGGCVAAVMALPAVVFSLPITYASEIHQSLQMVLAAAAMAFWAFNIHVKRPARRIPLAGRDIDAILGDLRAKKL